MNRNIDIVLYEEHEKVNYYTLCFSDEEATEFDKFLDQFPEGCKYDDDIDIILTWIDKIGERGAFERYFRVREGKMGDNVCAIPIELEDCEIRLYVIRLSDNVLILGNGGVKKTKTYNEDPHLNSCVELLQAIDGYLQNRLRNEQVSIFRNKLYGNLHFYLNK